MSPPSLLVQSLREINSELAYDLVVMKERHRNETAKLHSDINILKTEIKKLNQANNAFNDKLTKTYRENMILISDKQSLFTNLKKSRDAHHHDVQRLTNELRNLYDHANLSDSK